MTDAPTSDVIPVAVPEQVGNTCGSCKNGHMVEQNFKAPLECRRFPPQVTAFPMPTARGIEIMHHTQYPRVARLAPSCGEWVPRFEKQN